MNNKILICTVTLNSEKTIEKCLSSTYDLCKKNKNISHVLKDGISKDNTIKIVRSFPHVLYQPKLDTGIYDAFNKGIQKSSGDIIGFLHSSDFYQNSNYLNNVVEKFEETNCDILYTSVSQFNKDNSKIKIKRKWKADSFKKFKLNYGWMPPHCSTFVKREHYINNLYSTKYEISSDYNWLLKKLLKIETNKTQYLPDLYYMQRLDGVSTNKRFFIKKKI